MLNTANLEMPNLLKGRNWQKGGTLIIRKRYQEGREAENTERNTEEGREAENTERQEGREAETTERHVVTFEIFIFTLLTVLHLLIYLLLNRDYYQADYSDTCHHKYADTLHDTTRHRCYLV